LPLVSFHWFVPLTVSQFEGEGTWTCFCEVQSNDTLAGFAICFIPEELMSDHDAQPGDDATREPAPHSQEWFDSLRRTLGH
jgi:hypothetical protein